MIKLSDFVAQFLVDSHVQHVFMLTGGGAMHLNDSLGKHPKLEVIFNHHEQASAMAAESYARLTHRLAVVNVTTGPGGLNALNGVFGAWTDSIPMLVLSGQVRYDTTVRSTGLNLRQMGDQEYDIVKSVEPMTKYAAMVTDPNDILFHLQKALYLAATGRPGPVWLDIPMNAQGAMIDETKLRTFTPPSQTSTQVDPELIKKIILKIRDAQRPVLMVGTGVRISGAHKTFLKLIDALHIPVVTAFNAHDAVCDTHPYYAGRPGTVGDRAGNLVVQNADLLLVLGCRLNIRQIGYHWKSFAREAYKIAVDIDELELQKPTVKIDLPIHGNLATVIPQLLEAASHSSLQVKSDWMNWCTSLRKKFPVVLNEYWERKELINPYCFIEKLSEQLCENQIIVTADATACIAAFQALEIKKGQRLFSNSGCASMGYDLPAAIGACIGSEKKRIICLAGDGSIQQNIQELATIRHYQLPIKIFVINNQGYHSIRQTQENFFGKPLVGVCPDSGLYFPSLEKIASTYEIDYHHCDTHSDLEKKIVSTLNHELPALCELKVTTEQPFAPKASSKRLSDGKMVSRPLEDLAPFLSREELRDNMWIDLLPESQE